MSLRERIPPPTSSEWRGWAERLTAYLSKARQILASTLVFDASQDVTPAQGEIAWNANEDTLNIGHANGVVQQVGLEQYMRVENLTGSTIANGSVVGFVGVNGEIHVSKYTADGAANELYMVGVVTEDILNNGIGFATTYGKVRGLDTSAFTKGDILYADTATAGGLTNTRPTAPNVVIPVAVVLSVSATDGEILVKPTVPIGLDYGTFSDTSDQTLIAANTAYAITLGTTDISNGVSVVSSSRITVSQSGLYWVHPTLQLVSSNASATTVYAWLRKNGTDIPNTRFDITISANGDAATLSAAYQVSLAANDYIEVMWAADSTSMTLDAGAATAFAPARPSVTVVVSQEQL